jgi:hypothetical protein
MLNNHEAFAQPPQRLLRIMQKMSPQSYNPPQVRRGTIQTQAKPLLNSRPTNAFTQILSLFTKPIHLSQPPNN